MHFERREEKNVNVPRIIASFQKGFLSINASVCIFRTSSTVLGKSLSFAHENDFKQLYFLYVPIFSKLQVEK
jgi:hypothetical protein